MRVADIILIELDSRSIAGSAVLNKEFQTQKLGLEKYETYVNEQLSHKQCQFLIPSIGILNIYLASPPVRKNSSKQLQLSSLKSNYFHAMMHTMAKVTADWYSGHGFLNIKIRHNHLNITDAWVS